MGLLPGITVGIGATELRLRLAVVVGRMLGTIPGGTDEAMTEVVGTETLAVEVGGSTVGMGATLVIDEVGTRMLLVLRRASTGLMSIPDVGVYLSRFR